MINHHRDLAKIKSQNKIKHIFLPNLFMICFGWQYFKVLKCLLISYCTFWLHIHLYGLLVNCKMLTVIHVYFALVHIECILVVTDCAMYIAMAIWTVRVFNQTCLSKTGTRLKSIMLLNILGNSFISAYYSWNISTKIDLLTKIYTMNTKKVIYSYKYLPWNIVNSNQIYQLQPEK